MNKIGDPDQNTGKLRQKQIDVSKTYYLIERIYKGKAAHDSILACYGGICERNRNIELRVPREVNPITCRNHYEWFIDNIKIIDNEEDAKDMKKYGGEAVIEKSICHKYFKHLLKCDYERFCKRYPERFRECDYKDRF